MSDKNISQKSKVKSQPPPLSPPRGEVKSQKSTSPFIPPRGEVKSKKKIIDELL